MTVIDTTFKAINCNEVIITKLSKFLKKTVRYVHTFAIVMKANANDKQINETIDMINYYEESISSYHKNIMLVVTFWNYSNIPTKSLTWLRKTEKRLDRKLPGAIFYNPFQSGYEEESENELKKCFELSKQNDPWQRTKSLEFRKPFLLKTKRIKTENGKINYSFFITEEFFVSMYEDIEIQDIGIDISIKEAKMSIKKVKKTNESCSNRKNQDHQKLIFSTQEERRESKLKQSQFF